MGIAISTAGTKITYAWETTAGTRPTTGYTIIPDIKEVPALDSAPEALDTTTLYNEKYKTSIDGLIDLGGNIGLTANLTNEFQTAWEAFCAKKQKTRKKIVALGCKSILPDLTKHCLFRVIPLNLDHLQEA